ncbi:MAG: PDZ domain-containing protein [Planctomycetes bacterium]|nr:PDZ domain-containing protein [Planctomycetota bacterium]
MAFRVLAVVTALALLAAGARAGEPGPAEQAAAAAAAAPSLVRVEYTLRYDKGEEPRAGAWVQGGCPVRGRDTLETADTVKEERPLELGAFLIGPTTVVALDPMIHPRFVEGIAVRFKDDLVKARPAAYGKDQMAVLLELKRPLKGAVPLAFEVGRKPPYLAVTYAEADGVWTINVEAMPAGLSVTEAGRRLRPLPQNALIVDKSGAPVTLSMRDEGPADDSWKAPPSAWAVIQADDLAARLADVEKRLGAGGLRVTLHFRSPSKDLRGFRSRDDEEGATEQYAAGILVDAGHILVLANLKPGTTARLERILVRPAQGDAVPARFAGSLKDYGCLLAALEKPLAGAAAFSARPILDYRGVLLPAAELRLHGEEWTVYFEHRRIESFGIGWRRQVYPVVPGSSRDAALVLFDEAGALLALPVARREKVSVEERYASAEPLLTPVTYLKAVLDDLPNQLDAGNVPLAEGEESRLAWIGAELQPLDRELARANKVSDLTHDGESGAIVSYVYPNSPAARAGIDPGYILLRLRVEGQPKPLEVALDRDDRMEGPFPWEELDELQEQYYDRIPTPWPSIENSLTRALTDLGFGTRYKAECFHDGQPVLKDLEVVQSPPHYESAPRYKSQALGLTVRDVTYEVRRYFQKKDDEPGVIISKIEPGGKASVAGVKPYEIVTHVNDKPIANVKDFESAIQKQEELRLSVKRMTRGRVVKIKMAAAAAAPAKAPGPEKPAAEDGGANKTRRPRAGP